LTINTIISDAFKSDDSSDVPKELFEIINRFLEMEDSETHKDSAIINLFERRLETKYIPSDNDTTNEKKNFLDWCKDYLKP
jgi:hypothetical protein